MECTIPNPSKSCTNFGDPHLGSMEQPFISRSACIKRKYEIKIMDQLHSENEKKNPKSGNDLVKYSRQSNPNQINVDNSTYLPNCNNLSSGKYPQTNRANHKEFHVVRRKIKNKKVQPCKMGSTSPYEKGGLSIRLLRFMNLALGTKIS